MKTKLHLLAISILLCLQVNAQHLEKQKGTMPEYPNNLFGNTKTKQLLVKADDTRWVPDTITTYFSSSSIIREIYISNSKGMVDSILHQEKRSNAWVTRNLSINSYDDNGNLSISFYEIWGLFSQKWERTAQALYTYDERGNLLKTVSQNLHNNEWINSSQQLFTYDIEGNILSTLTQEWKNNAWDSTSFYEKSYDENHNLLTDQYKGTSYNNIWGGFGYRHSYTYDVNNNLLSHLEQSWQNGILENNLLETYTYDDRNNLLSETGQSWTNNSWINSSRRHNYIYDENGNALSYNFQIWENDEWVNFHQERQTYDNNNNELTHLTQSWTNNEWVNAYQYVRTFDENNNESTYLQQNFVDNEWVTSAGYQFIRTYNENEEVTTLTEQNWENNEWVNVSKAEFSYDKFGNDLTKCFWKWENNNWVEGSGGLAMYYNHGKSKTLPYTGHKVVVSYKEISPAPTTGIEIPKTKEKNFTVYPNPAINGILIIENGKLKVESEIASPSIRNDEVQLFDLAGKLAGTYALPNEKTILNISHLPNGIYFIKIANEMVKIIKK